LRRIDAINGGEYSLPRVMTTSRSRTSCRAARILDMAPCSRPEHGADPQQSGWRLPVARQVRRRRRRTSSAQRSALSRLTRGALWAALGGQENPGGPVVKPALVVAPALPCLATSAAGGSVCCFRRARQTTPR
jgi:hypothetical protein